MAEFTEKQVFEAFGLPENGGEQEQEPAAPAAQTSSADAAAQNAGRGEQEQEPAAPAQAEAEPVPNLGTEPAEGTAAPEGPEDDAGKQPLTPEQRRENAARRRQQEQQAAINQAVAAARQEEQQKNAAAMKDFFAKAGLKNTITGQPITNMEEFNAWQQEFNAAKLQRELKAGKLTPEGLSQAISDHPVIKQAQQIIRDSETAKRQQADAEAKAKIDTEIAEIGKLDPTIKSVEDLLAMPTAKEFYAYVKKGNTFLDAFYLANRERLENAKAEAAKQQALNNARSKDHLNATGNNRGSGAVSVPAEDLAMFRTFNPEASEAEIQAYFNKYKKG